MGCNTIGFLQFHSTLTPNTVVVFDEPKTFPYFSELVGKENFPPFALLFK